MRDVGTDAGRRTIRTTRSMTSTSCRTRTMALRPGSPAMPSRWSERSPYLLSASSRRYDSDYLAERMCTCMSLTSLGRKNHGQQYECENGV